VDGDAGRAPARAVVGPAVPSAELLRAAAEATEAVRPLPYPMHVLSLSLAGQRRLVTGRSGEAFPHEGMHVPAATHLEQSAGRSCSACMPAPCAYNPHSMGLPAEPRRAGV